MRKMFILLLFSAVLSFTVFAEAEDYSKAFFNVGAYKTNNYEKNPNLKVYVKQWADEGRNVGIQYNGVVTNPFNIPESKIVESNFDAFSVFIETNLKNPVTVSVSFSPFTNPRFSEYSFTLPVTRWYKYDDKGEFGIEPNMKQFSSGVVLEGTKYYTYRYYPKLELMEGNSFSFYYAYERFECIDPDNPPTGFSSENSKPFSGLNGIEVLPGIEVNKHRHKVEVVYRCPADKAKIDRLPEGVTFVSNVTITVEVNG